MRISILSLLLIFSCSFDFIHSCGYESFNDLNMTSSVQEYQNLKYRRSGGNPKPPDWTPISIFTHYDDNINKELDKTDVRDLSNYVMRAVRKLKGMLKVQSPQEIKVDLSGCQAGSGEQTIKMYDFVFFIKTKKCSGDTLATARSCHVEILKWNETTNTIYHPYHQEFKKNKQLNFVYGRPLAGIVDICIGSFKDRKRRTDNEKWVSTIMHEMTHALVFGTHLFKSFMRVKEGTNYLEFYDKAQFNFKIEKDQKMYEIPGVVKKIERDWQTEGGNIKHPVYVLSTPEVVKEVRERFGCTTLEGAELENHGGSGSVMSHFEKRIFEHETMGAIRTETNAFSRVTLAVFADSGWYQVDYSKADPVSFGLKKGCTFAKGSCGEYLNSATDGYPFCKGDDRRCSDDHTGIEQCNAFNNAPDPEIPLTKEYQYFPLVSSNKKHANGVPLSFADFCPYYSVFVMSSKEKKEERDTKCSTPDKSNSKELKVSLQIFSNTARCFQLRPLGGKGEGFHINLEKATKVARFQTSHGCYEHKCEDGSLWVKTAKSKFYRCYYDGQHVHVERRLISEKSDTKFTLICPPCENICGKICKDKKSEAPERVGDKPRTKKSMIDMFLGKSSGDGLHLTVFMMVFGVIWM